MIRSFANRGSADVFDGVSSAAARRVCREELWRTARRKLDQINQARALLDLRAPPANRLERLKGDRKGQYSVRINQQYRICFHWTQQGPEHVEIVDYHG